MGIVFPKDRCSGSKDWSKWTQLRGGQMTERSIHQVLTLNMVLGSINWHPLDVLSMVTYAPFRAHGCIWLEAICKILKGLLEDSVSGKRFSESLILNVRWYFRNDEP